MGQTKIALLYLIHLPPVLLASYFVEEGPSTALNLMAWQQIFHLECDVRPRERTVVVTELGEQRAASVCQNYLIKGRISAASAR
jgi:hypothetical protein